MESVYLSSTELKRKTAEILNLVAYGKKIAVIERYGEPLVRISPASFLGKKTKLEGKLDRYFGSIPDFPRVEKERFFRKRKLNL